MEEEEIIRAQYRRLLNKLYNINNKYQELNDLYDDMNNTLKSNLLVDDKSIVENEFIEMKKGCDNLENELVSSIIPNVRSKS